MDRILYFRIIGKKEYTKNYRIQVFRKEVLGMDIIYLQICGYPSMDSVLSVKDEMQKAVDRILSQTRRQEVILATHLVYEEGFQEWLKSMRYEKEWRRLWHAPVYTDYHAKENVQRMLQMLSKEQFPQEAWILGQGPGMEEWLPTIARQVRNLTFLTEFVTKGFEDMLEELEENFGLVAQVRLVTPGEWKKQRLRSLQPVLVMDFSGEEVIPVTRLGRGSIWMDMDSVDDKQHAMEERRAGVVYFSLKNLWIREMLQTLDTVGYFEYNTEVKIGRLGG